MNLIGMLSRLKLLVAGFVLLLGCSKKSESPDAGLLYYGMLAEVISDDAIQHFINKQGNWDTTGFLGSCASKEVSGNGNRVVYLYPEVNLPCQDGNKRSGELIGLHDGEDSIRITFNRYTFYQKKPVEFSGTIVLVRNHSISHTYNLFLYWEYHPSSGSTVSLKGNMEYQRSISFGSAESSVSDDATLQSGKGYWVSDGKPIYLVNWLNPQTRRNVDGCRQFVSGQAAVTHADYLPLTFDWGGGTCDRAFTITSSNTIQTQTLP